MIGRKLALIQNGYVFEKESEMPDVEYAEELKKWAKEGLRRLGFVLLVITIRLYVKSVLFIKKIMRITAEKVKRMSAKKSPDREVQEKEPSTFLQKIGDYKKKVRRIKEKVKKEERLK
jgi:hypothetical protein